MAPTGFPSFGEWVVYTASAVVAAGVLWRYVVRPLWRGWRRLRLGWRRLRLYVNTALEVVTRELTHNGGSSLKDTVHRMDGKLSALTSQIQIVKESADDNADALEAVAQVMDKIVDRKQEDHERLWQQIVALGGVDPRGESHR